jgi:transcriptional regulator with XRE-family HTH domain
VSHRTLSRAHGYAACVPVAVSSDELRARIAARIRELAKRERLPITRLADAAGVSRAHVWGVLAGRRAPTSDTIAKIAAALGVDPSALVRPYRGKPPAPPADE